MKLYFVTVDSYDGSYSCLTVANSKDAASKQIFEANTKVCSCSPIEITDIAGYKVILEKMDEEEF